jgi:hypothetical protein
MTTERRRLDRVLAEDFLSGIDAADTDEIERRRRLAREVENEVSYYRRIVHGRMDLIRFEMRRRSGEETRSIVDALPEILADPERSPSSGARYVPTDLPPLPDVGRRPIDQLLGDDVLTRLDEIDDAGLQSALEDLSEMEVELSRQRKAVQRVVDSLAAALDG